MAELSGPGPGEGRQTRPGPRGSWPSAPVLLAVALPLLLAVAVAVLGLTFRLRGGDVPAPETAPLAVVPVDAPDASGSECTAVLAALPQALPGNGAPLPPRPLADPVPAGTRAWVAAPRPVVLRCGLTRPAELGPTSMLLEVNGVQWLRLDDGIPDPAVMSYVAVDRPVYVVLTAPPAAGTGPLQAVSDILRETLPTRDVAVR